MFARSPHLLIHDPCNKASVNTPPFVGCQLSVVVGGWKGHESYIFLVLLGNNVLTQRLVLVFAASHNLNIVSQTRMLT